MPRAPPPAMTFLLAADLSGGTRHLAPRRFAVHTTNGDPRLPSPRPALWRGVQVALFDHRCPSRARAPMEFAVSAPCVVLVSAGAFLTSSAQGSAMGDPGTAIFRNALAPYTVRDLPGAPHAFTTVRVHPAAVRDIIRDLDPGAADLEIPTFPFAASRVPPGAQLLHALVLRTIPTAGDAAELALEEGALGLAALLIRSAYADHRGRVARARPTPRSRARVAAAREFLALRFRDTIRLADVARAAGCSPYHLARAFRAEVGTSIARHLTALRLRAALTRVLESGDGLTRVALDCGFCDHSHFTSVFGRRFGLSPSAARRASLADIRLLLRRPAG
jgi:AraC family transcriptional regulator